MNFYLKDSLGMESRLAQGTDTRGSANINTVPY